MWQSTFVMDIEIQVKQLEELKRKAWETEKQLKENLIELDRRAFGGKTWHEFMSSIDETVEVNEQIRIMRESYRVIGFYQINDDVSLRVDGNIYFGDERFMPTIQYKASGRYAETVPKKYQEQFRELKAEMRKYQFERPSDKYSQKLGMTSF